MADIPALVETSDPPLSTDSDAQFDAKAFPWMASLNPFGQSVSAIAIAARDNAEDALAAALGGDLPPLTGEALKFLRVKSDESGAEFAEVPEPVTQPTADWEAGTSTTEGIVSPAKVKAAVDALVPDNALVPDDPTKVGALVFAGKSGPANPGYGDNVGGSGVRVAQVGRFSSGNGAYLSSDPNFSGTWRCLGELTITEGTSGGDEFGLATLFVRIS